MARTFVEPFTLALQNNFNNFQQRVLALGDGVDQPTGGADSILHKFFGGRVGGFLLGHDRVALTHAQRRNGTVANRRDITILLRIKFNHHIWNNWPLGFIGQVAARRNGEPSQSLLRGLDALHIHSTARGDFWQAILQQIVVMLLHQHMRVAPLGLVLRAGPLVPTARIQFGVYLNQQTFAHIARRNASWLKPFLQQRQHALQFLLGYGISIFDGVRLDRRKIRGKQTVIIHKIKNYFSRQQRGRVGFDHVPLMAQLFA